MGGPKVLGIASVVAHMYAYVCIYAGDTNANLDLNLPLKLGRSSKAQKFFWQSIEFLLVVHN